MTKDEAMRLALDALEDKFLYMASDSAVYKRAEAIDALNAALAQHEPEPAAWLTDRNELFFDKEDAYRYSDGFIIPLYTAPPQKKEWIGLTQEEKQVCYWFECPAGADPGLFAERIEKRLKEKNS